MQSVIGSPTGVFLPMRFSSPKIIVGRELTVDSDLSLGLNIRFRGWRGDLVHWQCCV